MNHSLRQFVIACLASLIVTSAALAADDGAAMPDGRYLYMAQPDGAQTENRSGVGILVFDLDHDFRLVRRIPVEHIDEGVRGMTGSLVNHALYMGTTNRHLTAVDLETGKTVWQKQYPLGCDRSCITPDGKKLYVPTGWWYAADDGGFLVIDPADGSLMKRLSVGPQAHNSIAAPSGRLVLLGTRTRLTVFDPADDHVVHTIDPVGEVNVFPYTLTSDERTAYVCLGKHVGFDIVDLAAGKVTGRVMALDDAGKTITHRTHGAGLTPDESELWISDQVGKRLYIFDNTVTPPKQIDHVDLSSGGHGWICFSLDAKYAFCHTPDIFDAHTHKLIAQFKDETGKPVGGSKFIEVHFKNGKVTAMGNEFGLGRKTQQGADASK
ncbi:MAG: PQQ-binding-like beta-propeller repeat protein [Planctomycetes bacterium]|nr:PQQ-binding-like beta-propeller repeat protein [Planctomycetota bacterium]